MPIGNVAGDKLVVITERSDLGWGKGKHGNWWALRAFSAMCDAQDELPYPYERWTFPASIRLAVERILKERGRELEIVDKPDFEVRLSRIIYGKPGAEEEGEE